MTQASHLVVRPLQSSDAPSLLGAVLASLSELTYWMPWCHSAYSMADAEAWIKFSKEAWETAIEYPLGVFDASSGQLIGGTGINHINKAYRIGNIGYWVSTPYTNAGVARFAARQAAEIGFQKLGLTRLEIVVLTHNKASQRVAESLGAVEECIARNRLYFRSKPHGAVVYSLVPEDLSPIGARSMEQ